MMIIHPGIEQTGSLKVRDREGNNLGRWRRFTDLEARKPGSVRGGLIPRSVG